MGSQVDGNYVLQECAESSSIDLEPKRVVSETLRLLEKELSRIEKKTKLTNEDESETPLPHALKNPMTDLSHRQRRW